MWTARDSDPRGPRASLSSSQVPWRMGSSAISKALFVSSSWLSTATVMRSRCCETSPGLKDEGLKWTEMDRKWSVDSWLLTDMVCLVFFWGRGLGTTCKLILSEYKFNGFGNGWMLLEHSLEGWIMNNRTWPNCVLFRTHTKPLPISLRSHMNP